MGARVCVCVCACVRACVRARVGGGSARACVCVFVRAWVCARERAEAHTTCIAYVHTCTVQMMNSNQRRHDTYKIIKAPMDIKGEELDLTALKSDALFAVD